MLLSLTKLSNPPHINSYQVNGNIMVPLQTDGEIFLHQNSIKSIHPISTFLDMACKHNKSTFKDMETKE